MKYFNEWMSLRESMSVYVDGHDHQNDINDLDDIANQIKKKVLYPAWDKLTPEDQENVKKGGSAQHSMITPDGDYYGDGKLLINFYSAGWPEQMLPNIINGIKYFLDEMKVKYGPFETNQSGMYNSPVVRIPILQFNATENSPPLLNLSNVNAYSSQFHRTI